MQKSLTVELYPAGTDVSKLLLQVKGQLTLPTAVVDLKSRSTSVALDDAPGTTIVLDITVPSIGGNSKSAFLIHQEFMVDKAGVLQPTKSNGDGPLHPRISFRKTNASGFPPILVDLLFVDVTYSIRGLGRLDGAPAKDSNSANYDSDWPNGEPNGGTPHYGCKLFILELTVGKPKTWAVIVPPAARRDSNDTNVLLFFPPAMPPYTSTLDFSYGYPSLERYSKDPPTYGPFFLYSLGKNQDTGLEMFKLRTFPETGFEGQLVASGKPVILVIPFPHTEGDQVNYGKAKEANLKELLSALVRVIWEKVPPGPKRPKGVPSATSIAVGGYSHGGAPAIEALRNNESTVSELYLFDSTEPVAGNTLDFIKRWFKNVNCAQSPNGSADGHKLRMIGAFFLDQVLKARDAILQDSANVCRKKDVSVTPADASFFNTVGNIYHAALSVPGETALEALTPLSAMSTTTSGLSFNTNIWLKSSTPKTILACPLKQPAGRIDEREVKCTPVEAAAIVKGQWLHTGADKIEDAQAFDNLMKFLQPDKTLSDGLGAKHQWAIDGGVGNPKRWPYGIFDPTAKDPVFEGYLLFCLKDSGFK